MKQHSQLLARAVDVFEGLWIQTDKIYDTL